MKRLLTQQWAPCSLQALSGPGSSGAAAAGPVKGGVGLAGAGFVTLCIPVPSSWERWLSRARCHGRSGCCLGAVTVFGLVTACQSRMHRAQAFRWLRRQPAQVSWGQSWAVSYEPCLIRVDSTELFRSLQYAHKMPIMLDFSLSRVFQSAIMSGSRELTVASKAGPLVNTWTVWLF